MFEKSVWLRLVCSVVVVASAFSAFAQGGPPPGGPGGPGGPGMQRGPRQMGPNPRMVVLQMSSVQKEIGLTASQLEAIKKLVPPGGTRGPGGPGRGPGGQGGAGRGPGGPGGQGGAENPPMRDPLGDILEERQIVRLNQIAFQFQGVMAWLNPRHASQLNLSEEQRDGLVEILRDINPPIPPRGEGDGPPPRPNWQEMMKKRAEGIRRGLALLNGEQKTVLARIGGKEFTAWEEPKGPPR